MLAPTKLPLPASLSLVLLVLALPGCAPSDPEVAEGDTSGSTGESGLATTDETGSIDTGSGDTGTSDSGSDPSCGNGSVEADEDCDDEGESPTCDADCTAAACGDMTVNMAAGEECDGINLAGATCRALGFTEGLLACGEGCAYDTSGCVPLPAEPVLTLGFSAIKQFEFTWTAAEGAEFYRLEESPAPGEPFVPLGDDIVGESITLTMPLHLRFGASYRLHACNARGCSSSAPVQVVSSLADAVGYVKASNTGADDHFGWVVALSGDGSTLAVGATDEASSASGIDGNQADDSASSSGAVYVFIRDDVGGWSQQAYIKASNPDPSDELGNSLALSEDGNTLAVGAQLERSNATGIDGDQADDSAQWAGAVYVFVRDGGGAWAQQAYVKASNTDLGDRFGASVALSDDGDTLAVGAYGEDGSAPGIDGDQTDDSTSWAGAVYVLVRDGAGTWSHQAYVKASNPDQDDYFGEHLALSGDGNTLAVGAMFEDGSSPGIDGDQADDSTSNAGAVYVLVRDGMGAWSQQAYLKASNPDLDDWFGSSVALSDDGHTLAVGARGESSNATGPDGDQTNDSAPDAGAVYVLVRDGMGTWSQQAYLKASTAGVDDNFGGSVALSGDGNVLAVGAFVEDGNATGIGGDETDDSITDSGAVYVLVRDDAGAWTQRAYVKASNPGDLAYFGSSVALSEAGDVLAASATRDASNATGIGGDQANGAAIGSGAVYLY